MTLEISVALLVLLLSLILAYYNQRQASALRGVERLVQDFVAMQVRDRRSRHIEGLAERIDPLGWLARQVSVELDTPLEVSEVLRVVQEVQAVELRTTNGHRLVVSTEPRSILLRHDRRQRRAPAGGNAAGRVASFGARPLLGSSRWGMGVRSIERVLSPQQEFFDLEAQAVSDRLGLKWDRPSRLWFHVVR